MKYKILIFSIGLIAIICFSYIGINKYNNSLDSTVSSVETKLSIHKYITKFNPKYLVIHKSVKAYKKPIHRIPLNSNSNNEFNLIFRRLETTIEYYIYSDTWSSPIISLPINDMYPKSISGFGYNKMYLNEPTLSLHSFSYSRYAKRNSGKEDIEYIVSFEYD